MSDEQEYIKDQKTIKKKEIYKILQKWLTSNYGCH